MPLSRSFRVALALGLAGALVASAPRDAAATKRAKVVFSAVELPRGDDEEALTKYLSKLAEAEARRADFGPARDEPLEATLRVTELSVVVSKDVVRVEAALVGKLVGGGVAKSRMSMGGHPKDREKLEKQVLAMLGRGVVARLAAMARAHAPAR